MIDIPRINDNVRLRGLSPQGKYLYLVLLGEADSNGVLRYVPEDLTANWFFSLPEYEAAEDELFMGDIVRKNDNYMMVRYYQEFAPARRKPRILHPQQSDLIEPDKGYCLCPDVRLKKEPKVYVPTKEIVTAYNTILGAKGCPAHLVTTDQMYQKIRKRWMEDEQRQDLQWWHDLFNHIADHCPFLIGATGKDWTCSLEWLTRPENLAKVINGFYDNKQGAYRPYGKHDQRDNRYR